MGLTLEKRENEGTVSGAGDEGNGDSGVSVVSSKLLHEVERKVAKEHLSVISPGGIDLEKESL